MANLVIAKFAAISRILIVSIAILTAKFCNDYDISVQVVDSSSIRSLIRWDAVYFLEIAKNGYSYEQQFAFFPGYPFLIRMVSKFLFLDYRWAGILISNLSFVLAATVLHRLSLQLNFRPKTAMVASILYCLNLSSIFMSSVYTESIFALFSFMGMLAMTKRYYFWASICFFAASATRSNGILYAGFFGWEFIHRRLHIVKAIGLMIIVVAPFVCFQYYGYHIFCEGVQDRPEWCNQQLPMLYSHVQKHYWNNGFLKYYTLRQLPNFVLATPMIIFLGLAFSSYYSKNSKTVLSLGIIKTELVQLDFHSVEILPYFYLALFMYCYCILFMHIQVILRFFTSQPVLYWYLASLMADKKPPWYSKLFIGYSIIYGFVGAVLFGSFLPPA